MSKLCRYLFYNSNLTHTIVKHQLIQKSLAISVNQLSFRCPNSIKPFTINNVNFVRHKTTKKKGYDSDEDDTEEYSNDEALNKDSKVLKFKTTSMRTDLILKQGLGIARNKVEQIFYESKIRLNGKKILKKSAAVREGDELDMIKTISPHNPKHLYISRIEILNIKANEENISVTVRRFKTLLIENYEEHPYKVSTNEN